MQVGGGIQLSATPTTHYYINPNLPATKQIHNVYNELLGPMPLLQVQPYRRPNVEEDKYKNRVSLKTLSEINPGGQMLHSYWKRKYGYDQSQKTLSTRDDQKRIRGSKDKKSIGCIYILKEAAKAIALPRLGYGLMFQKVKETKQEGWPEKPIYVAVGDEKVKEAENQVDDLMWILKPQMLLAWWESEPKVWILDKGLFVIAVLLISCWVCSILPTHVTAATTTVSANDNTHREGMSSTNVPFADVNKNVPEIQVSLTLAYAIIQMSHFGTGKRGHRSRSRFCGDDLDAVEDEPQENEGISMIGGTQTVTESSNMVQTKSDIDILDDGYRWRK
ncbi:DNA-binding WRKY [Artemisia annua]|uniref:DNA-binding WRKY n=1 Tax=Artemisia annua TaxID=35608 RepID=A0A2U1MB23_ARTAN|nr:DNA-binding WRKY [Artemisia annua]